jgi:hypothetical protein
MPKILISQCVIVVTLFLNFLTGKKNCKIKFFCETWVITTLSWEYNLCNKASVKLIEDANRFHIVANVNGYLQ